MALIGLHTVNNTHTWTATNPPGERKEKVSTDKGRKYTDNGVCVGVCVYQDVFSIYCYRPIYIWIYLKVLPQYDQIQCAQLNYFSVLVFLLVAFSGLVSLWSRAGVKQHSVYPLSHSCSVSVHVLGQCWSGALIDKTVKTSPPLPSCWLPVFPCLYSRESRYAVRIDRSFQVHKPWDQQHRGRGQFK